MRLVIDIEANSLENPTEIWVIVCKDIDTGIYHVFREVTKNAEAHQAFLALLADCSCLIGHYILGYDLVVLRDLLQVQFDINNVIDTLIVSRLADYSRPYGHSIETYGIEFGFPKGKNHFPDFFKKWSQELEIYCVRDVDICYRIYSLYLRYINDYRNSIKLEQDFQGIANILHTNGFSLNVDKVNKLLAKVTEELNVLDKEIEASFPPKLVPIKEIHPRLTLHGTINRSDFRWVKDGDLSEFNGGPFTRCEWKSFNPSSHNQIIEVLHSAGWSPVDRTETHKDTLRDLARSKYAKKGEVAVDITLLNAKLLKLEKSGWKINEANLSTLPKTAPASARSLAKRIMYESRRRTLTEWLGLIQDDGRIHGEFQGIGAWTHRMAHQKPNTANIPNEYKEDGSKKLLGKELRSCWQAPRGRLLAGVDAEGIQLRIFAHLINDKELIERIVNGSKSDKTDPHSYNQEILRCAKTRQAAKRFLYALFLGGGLGRLAQILEVDQQEAEAALDRLIKRYPGFDYVKRNIIPSDAKRGYFIGLDGRKVSIPGDTVGERRHLAMSGYLQNGEAVVMKLATCRWYPKLQLKYPDQWKLVNLVHDEWQIEVPNNMEIATDICSTVSASLREVGEELKLNCPLAGSYMNDHNDYTIGTNWAVTH